MENFMKAFEKVAARYTAYVDAKLVGAVNITRTKDIDTAYADVELVGAASITNTKDIDSLHEPKQTAEQLHKEIELINNLAQTLIEINKRTIELSSEDIEHIQLTETEQEELEKKMLYAITKDTKTGEIEILPMNRDKKIILNGEEMVKCFINQLWETIKL